MPRYVADVGADLRALDLPEWAGLADQQSSAWPGLAAHRRGAGGIGAGEPAV